MATVEVELTAEQLEAKRAALILRQAELVEVLELFPGQIAVAREMYYRMESPSRKRRLLQVQDGQQAAEVELLEVRAGLETVDRLLAEHLARERAAHDERVRAEVSELSQKQADALGAFGEAFASLWTDHFPEYVRATAELAAAYQANRGAIGERAPFITETVPITFHSLLSLCHAALIRDQIGRPVPAALAAVIPAAADRPLELDLPNVQRV